MEEIERKHRDAQLGSWMAACAQGDAAALESLYSALAPQLFGLLLRILRRRDLAEEALQETFVSAWRKAAEYRASRGTVTIWMLTIARHRAFDVLRRERREVALDPETLTAMSDAAPPEEENFADSPSLAEYRRLRRCLETLSAEQRSSILLAYFQGRTQEEIAARLGAPLGTVKSWVRRALVSLKRCLET